MNIKIKIHASKYISCAYVYTLLVFPVLLWKSEHIQKNNLHTERR